MDFRNNILVPFILQKLDREFCKQSGVLRGESVLRGH